MFGFRKIARLARNALWHRKFHPEICFIQHRLNSFSLDRNRIRNLFSNIGNTITQEIWKTQHFLDLFSHSLSPLRLKIWSNSVSMIIFMKAIKTIVSSAPKMRHWVSKQKCISVELWLILHTWNRPFSNHHLNYRQFLIFYYGNRVPKHSSWALANVCITYGTQL